MQSGSSHKRRHRLRADSTFWIHKNKEFCHGFHRDLSIATDLLYPDVPCLSLSRPLFFSHSPSAPGICALLYLFSMGLTQSGFDLSPRCLFTLKKCTGRCVDPYKSFDHSLLLLLLPHPTYYNRGNQKNHGRPLQCFQGSETCKSKLI